MATVNFLYRSTKDQANLILRLLYRLNNTDFVLAANTKFEVEYYNWFGHHAEIKENKGKGIRGIKIKGTKDTAILNKRLEVTNELNKIENHILKAFNSATLNDINKIWLQTQLDYYYNPPQQNELPKALISYIDKYTEIKKNELTESTIKKCNVIKQLLTRYQTHAGKTIFISEIDKHFKTEFESYCLSNNYAPNTIARALRFVKTICKNAQSNGMEIHYQLDSIKIRYQKTENIYLTENELEAIANKTDLAEYLDNAKDWLLISSYTGQRISDFMRFKKDMIRYEKNKQGITKPLIEFTQKKTRKIMTVPLSEKVMDILNKRNGEFPRALSDVNYNLYIKEVCKAAKINEHVKGSKKTETEENSKIYRNENGTFKKWELVTSHIGRRSFASNNYGKIPTSFLIYVTGHSTEAMFLNYIGKSNKDIAMELTNYF